MNVIKEYVDFSIKNLEEYTRLMMGKYFNKKKYQEYATLYEEVRYYNLRIPQKSSLEANLNYYLEEVYLKEESNLSKFILELFRMFYYLDGVKKFSEKKNLKKFLKELNEIREEKLGIVDETFIPQFRKMVFDNEKRKIKYLKAYDSSVFSLKIVKVINHPLYWVYLEDHIEIPKLYSEYAIDKVNREESILIGKMFVCCYLVNALVLKNVIRGSFSKKYFVRFQPKIFFLKDRFAKFMKMMDNDISKENIILLITPNQFLEYQEDILKMIHLGFSYSLLIDNFSEYQLIRGRTLDYFSEVMIDKKVIRNDDDDEIKNNFIFF